MNATSVLLVTVKSTTQLIPRVVHPILTTHSTGLGSRIFLRLTEYLTIVQWLTVYSSSPRIRTLDRNYQRGRASGGAMLKLHSGSFEKLHIIQSIGYLASSISSPGRPKIRRLRSMEPTARYFASHPNLTDVTFPVPDKSGNVLIRFHSAFTLATW